VCTSTIWNISTVPTSARSFSEDPWTDTMSESLSPVKK
jgi:hypothetical protein